MAWTQAELEALKAAYASGTLRVAYDGRTVDYASEADLLRRIRTVEREITVTTSGRRAPAAGLATFSRG